MSDAFGRVPFTPNQHYTPGLITVLMLTRQRPDMLRRNIESLLDHAVSPSRVEILVNVEPDDLASSHVAEGAGAHGVIVQPERLGWAGIHRYHLDMLATSHGEWFVLDTDDTFIETPGWDSCVLKASPGVLESDGHPGQNPVPIVHREVFRVLSDQGGMHDTPHYDVVLTDIARRAGVLYPSGIVIHHDSPQLGRRKADQTWAEAQAAKNDAQYFQPNFVRARELDAAALKAWLS